jgi:hypothetical protein
MSFGSWPRSQNKLEKSGILYARKVRFTSPICDNLSSQQLPQTNPLPQAPISLHT